MMLGTLIVVLAAHAVQPEIRPIDAGTEDVSVNSQSRLVPLVDQRQPIDFDQVFELTKPNGERVFIRRSGNLYAEFERSVYTSSGNPDIPPGTVFRIGDPLQQQATEVADAPNRVSLAAGSTSAGGRTARRPNQGGGSVAAAVGEPSIMGNELYRQVRISQLLMATVQLKTSVP